MTKKELLNVMNSNLVIDEVCKNLIVRINDTLSAFPDNVEIEYFTSLDDFIKEGAFNQTRLDAPRDLERELEKILAELQTWVKRQVEKGQVYAAEINVLNKKRKNNVISRIIVGVVLIAIAAVAIVFTGLRLKYEELYKWVPEIIGSVDLIIGIIFFIYEHWEDSKKDKLHNEADNELNSGNSKNFCEKYTVVNNTDNRNITKGFSKVVDNSTTIINNNYNTED